MGLRFRDAGYFKMRDAEDSVPYNPTYMQPAAGGKKP